MGEIRMGSVNSARKTVSFVWAGTAEDEGRSNLSATVHFGGKVDWRPRYLGREPDDFWIPKKDFNKMIQQAGAILNRLKKEAQKKVLERHLERQRQAVPF